MKDIERYQIMREFRNKHKISDDLNLHCPDPNYYGDEYVRCDDLCEHIWRNVNDCPCTEWGCSTALRKLDVWLRKEKKRLGV